jgi:hypothetical protein
MSSRAVPFLAGLLLSASLVTTALFCNCQPGSEPRIPARCEGRVLDKRHEPAWVEELERDPASRNPPVHWHHAERWMLRLRASWGEAWVTVPREDFEGVRVGDWYGGR